MTKPRLYLETTIPSYLTAWPSLDPYRQGQQQLTKEWWQKQKSEYEIVISEFVWNEAAAGDPEAATERLEILKSFRWLESTELAIELAEALVKSGIIPVKAQGDAAHIALSAVHEVDYLMTWNCTHIANATITKQVRKKCQEFGVTCPEICTPAELMGENNET